MKFETINLNNRTHIVNIENIAYIEYVDKGGAKIHFNNGSLSLDEPSTEEFFKRLRTLGISVP